MRKKQYEIKDVTVIEEILAKSEVCRIAMIDNGKPYIIPMNYGYKNNTIYFHSSPLGKKIEILKKNNLVCFEMEMNAQVVKKDIPCDWTTKYRSVIGYGTIEFITDNKQKKEGLDIIMAHYGKKDKNIYQDKNFEKTLVLKLNIEEMTGKQHGDINQI